MNVFDKEKSTVKQTVDSPNDKSPKGGKRGILTKRNVIITVVALFVILMGLGLLVEDEHDTGGTSSGSRNSAIAPRDNAPNRASLGNGVLDIIPDLNIYLGMQISEVPEYWGWVMEQSGVRGVRTIWRANVRHTYPLMFEGHSFRVEVTIADQCVDTGAYSVVDDINIISNPRYGMTQEQFAEITYLFAARYGEPELYENINFPFRVYEVPLRYSRQVFWEYEGNHLSARLDFNNMAITFRSFRR